MSIRDLAIVAALAAICIVGVAPDARAQAGGPVDAEENAYVTGNLMFLTYHEVGHMILDQALDVDQQSDRRASEETADDIATWLMLPDPDEPQQDEEIWAAVEGWQRSAELQQGVAQSPHYPDDEERASRIACYVYGSNPGLYPKLAKAFSVSIGSVDCVEEVEALHGDLLDWFGGHLVSPDAPDGRAIRVVYQEARGDLLAARAYLIRSRVLDDAAEDIAQFIRLPNEVTLVARSCGPGSAEFLYSPSTRQITACYEAVDWLMKDANDEQHDVSSAGSVDATSGDQLGSGGARVTRRPRPRGR